MALVRAKLTNVSSAAKPQPSIEVQFNPRDYTIAASDKLLKEGARAWQDFLTTKQRLTDKIRRAFGSVGQKSR